MVAYFVGKLNLLKIKTIEWAKEKKKKDEEYLRIIKESLARLKDPFGGGYVSTEAKEKVIKLKVDHLGILKDREEIWRLKSRAIWLQARDENPES